MLECYDEREQAERNLLEIVHFPKGKFYQWQVHIKAKGHPFLTRSFQHEDEALQFRNFAIQRTPTGSTIEISQTEMDI